MGKFHWLELIFFSCFLDIFVMHRIHMQLQTGENTWDLSSAKTWDEAIMKIQLQTVPFQMQCGKHPHREKGPLPPAQVNSLPKHPVWVCLGGMCSWEKKAAGERRNEPLMKCESPTKHLILNRKAPGLSLMGSQDQKRFQKKIGLDSSHSRPY